MDTEILIQYSKSGKDYEIDRSLDRSIYKTLKKYKPELFINSGVYTIESNPQFFDSNGEYKQGVYLEGSTQSKNFWSNLIHFINIDDIKNIIYTPDIKDVEDIFDEIKDADVTYLCFTMY